MAIVISAQLIFGEMVPKFYAIDRAESVARRIARPLQGFAVLFRPIIRATDDSVGADPPSCSGST